MSAEDTNIRIAVPWAVKFPEIEPPDTFKVDVPDEGDDFFPLAIPLTRKPNYTGTGEVQATLTGMQQVQQNVPVTLMIMPELIDYLHPIMGNKTHKGKKVVVVQIGRDEDDEATRMWKCELKHPTIVWLGDGAVQVTYKDFETFLYRDKGGPVPGGFNEYTQSKHS